MNVESLNSLILKELAEVVNKEVFIPNALITVSFVECDPSLKYAKVGFSVLPDNVAGTTLKKLNAASGSIANSVKKRIKIRKFPHLTWTFDPTERKATEIEKLLENLD